MGNISKYGFKNHFDVANTTRFYEYDIDYINLTRDSKYRNKFTYEDSNGNTISVEMLEDGTADFKIGNKVKANLSVDEFAVLVSNDDIEGLARIKRDNKEMIDSYAEGGEIVTGKIKANEKEVLLDVLYKAKFDAEAAGNKGNVAVVKKLIGYVNKGSANQNKLGFKSMFAKGGELSDESYRAIYNSLLYREDDNINRVKEDVHNLAKDESMSLQELLDEAYILDDSYAKGGDLSPGKAQQMLDDGYANGHPLTYKQKRYFHSVINRKDVLAKGGDLNDPVLVRSRASRDKYIKQRAKEKSLKNKHGNIDLLKSIDVRNELDDLNKRRDQLFVDMEQEAEPEGGPISNRYGNELNMIESDIEDLKEKLIIHDQYAKGGFLPYYTPRGLDEIREELKLKGFNSYTPEEKDYKYEEKSAVFLTTNVAGDLYGKDTENLTSNGNVVMFNSEYEYPKREYQTQKSYNTDIFLVIPYNKEYSGNIIKRITDKDYHIDFDLDKNTFRMAKGGFVLSGGKDKITEGELYEVVNEIKNGYGWTNDENLEYYIETSTGKNVKVNDFIYDKDGLLAEGIHGEFGGTTIKDYAIDFITLFPTSLDVKNKNTDPDIHIVGRRDTQRGTSNPWATSSTDKVKYFLAVEPFDDEANIKEYLIKWARGTWKSGKGAPIGHSFEVKKEPIGMYSLDDLESYTLIVSTTIYYN